MYQIGERLKTLRLKKALTQRQVATILGLRVSSISSYESGDRKPFYSILIKYASLFHVSMDYILGVEKKQTLDVTGLNDTEISSLVNIIEKYRANK